MKNLDDETAKGFDSIWKLHGSREAVTPSVSSADEEAFATYFSIFPLGQFSDSEGFELGCGNGRIARHVAPHVGLLHCIDPSPAGLASARQAMRHLDNVRFHEAAVDSIPLADDSQDFGYSVGVLHHIPRPEAGLRCCVRKLKPGAPFLLYVYYSFDNRPRWFRLIWRAADMLRKRISKLPFRLRSSLSSLLAATLYWPLSRTARLMEKFGVPVGNVPLSYYRHRNWAVLRADALDRFGTAVEHRFSKTQVEAMMLRCGLQDVRFADGPPFWIAVGHKS